MENLEKDIAEDRTSNIGAKEELQRVYESVKTKNVVELPLDMLRLDDDTNIFACDYRLTILEL